MSKKNFLSQFTLCFILLLYLARSICISEVAAFDAEEVGVWVPKDQRRSLVSTEYGAISAANVTVGTNGSYHLQFITLEPNALFLPVILNVDMVFYVHTGSGSVKWIEEVGDEDENGDKGKFREVGIEKGDVYRLIRGSAFFIQSSLEPERQKLRISAIFDNSGEPLTGPYSSIRDLVLGFDKTVLQVAFQAPDEVVQEITSAKKPPAIVHGLAKPSSRTLSDFKARFLPGLFGRQIYNIVDISNKKKKKGVYNILTGDKDVENPYGWSTTVTKKQLRSLKRSNIGVFMVNLSRGAIMAPHWNPTATEIAIVLEGRGMVRVVCPSITTSEKSGCKNSRIRVKEGDLFVVPRFHPMAQMSFNNGTFIFVGFTTINRENHPQFLAGKWSVLRTLESRVLAASFGVSNSTVSQFLGKQDGSVILECVSCAEKEERMLEEEIEKEKEEESKREEEKRREEEEARKREDEKKRKKEEEEAQKRAAEEEARRKEEEARKREEEEARKREEEKKRKKEEEEAQKRAAEEEARRKEEEARKREEEEARKREEEKKRKKEEEEAQKRAAEEEARRKEEEARKREEEEARKREEEKKRKEKEEEEAQKRAAEEEARRKEEEEAQKSRRKKEEEARKRAAEEEARKEEEEAQKRAAEEEARRKEEEEGRKRAAEEETRRKEEKEAQKRAAEKEAQRKAEEEARKRAEEEARREEEAAAKEEEEAARQQEEREKQPQQGGGHGGSPEQEETAAKEEEEAARKQEEMEKGQQEGERGRGGGQQEPEYWPGGGGEGRRFMRKMWTG